MSVTLFIGGVAAGVLFFYLIIAWYARQKPKKVEPPKVSFDWASEESIRLWNHLSNFSEPENPASEPPPSDTTV